MVYLEIKRGNLLYRDFVGEHCSWRRINLHTQRVIKFLESLSIFTCTFCSRGISRNEFVTATALSEELIDFVLFFICKWSNLSFSRSVWRHSWWNFSWFFFWQKTVFLRLSVFSFFSWTSSSWAFFFICFISSLFHLFRASLWRLFASSDLFQLKKKMPRIIKICSKGLEALLWVYFLFLSLSSVLSFFFVFLSFLSFSDNFR